MITNKKDLNKVLRAACMIYAIVISLTFTGLLTATFFVILPEAGVHSSTVKKAMAGVAFMAYGTSAIALFIRSRIKKDIGSDCE
ncbi:hypothetical protein ABEP16_05070 [Priestia aryabhattai]|uniref:hypothetical protein n=1 Tax=Priestia aryabhattai TaxID=412384 RepID=UPI001C0AA473|nr:hypothetical protein [Priestia aryabhattai]MBU3571433.1 hypothetical protein [Priestia aryabhattai]